MKILKFGGTSMGDEHTWRTILDIIKDYKNPVIVVSATARTTRQLVAATELAPAQPNQAKEIAKGIKKRHTTLVHKFFENNTVTHSKNINQECMLWIDQCIQSLYDQIEDISTQETATPSQKDAISSIGEQLSAYLFAKCGRAYGLSTIWVDAASVIKTDSNFGQATPNKKLINQQVYHLSNQTNQSKIPVMGGFYGENKEHQITTLGFEGSDYTASLIAATLGAEAVEIWTDVSGIYTCDPRVVEHARPIPELSFQEATELAYFGAKVLHPSTLKPVASANIPVYVKNIFDPGHPGTKIHVNQRKASWAKAITYLNNIVILTITADESQEGHQFLAAVFGVLDDAKIAVNAVTTTEASVSVALPNDERIEELQNSLSNLGIISLKASQGLISLIGCSFQKIDSIQEHVFSNISEVKPTLISYSDSKKNLNIAVSEIALVTTVCRIHTSLFGEEDLVENKK